MIQNAKIGKNIRVIIRHDLMKMKEETRSIRRKALSKEEIDFHLLMALAFYDFLRQKSGKLASMLGAIVK